MLTLALCQPGHASASNRLIVLLCVRHCITWTPQVIKKVRNILKSLMAVSPGYAAACTVLLLLLLLPRPAASECRQVHDPAGTPVHTSRLCGGSLIQSLPFCTRVEYLSTGVQTCSDSSCWIFISLSNQNAWLRVAAVCGTGSAIALCPADMCKSELLSHCQLTGLLRCRGSVAACCTAASSNLGCYDQPKAVAFRTMDQRLSCIHIQHAHHMLVASCSIVTSHDVHSNALCCMCALCRFRHGVPPGACARGSSHENPAVHQRMGGDESELLHEGGFNHLLVLQASIKASTDSVLSSMPACLYAQLCVDACILTTQLPYSAALS